MRSIVLAVLIFALSLLAPVVLDRFMKAAPEWIARAIPFVLVVIATAVALLADPSYKRLQHPRANPVSSTAIVTAAAAIVAGSLWWFLIANRTAPGEAPRPAAEAKPSLQRAEPPTPKTLRERFNSDLGMNDTRRFTIETEEAFGFERSDKPGEKFSIRLLERVYYDIDTRSKYYGTFIPAGLPMPTVGLCLFAVDHAQQAIAWADEHSSLKFKQIGERDVDANALKFNGAVFIYHEEPLLDAAVDLIHKEAASRGLNVTLRGVEYADGQNYYDYSSWQAGRPSGYVAVGGVTVKPPDATFRGAKPRE